MPAALDLTVPRGHAADETTQKSISRLIDDLGNANFEVREKAAHRLAEMEDAEAALREAQKSKDLEIRHRVKIILLALERRRALRGLARAHALSKTGRGVEAVDRLVKWRAWDTKGEGWDSLSKFAGRAMDNAVTYFPSARRVWKHPEFPTGGDFQRYAKTVQPKEISTRKVDIDMGEGRPPVNSEQQASRALFSRQGLYRAEEISIKGIVRESFVANSMLVATGDIQTSMPIYTLIVAGGDVKLTYGLERYNFIVCDGDVVLQDPEANKQKVLAEKCIIVARGKVTCQDGKFSECLVRSGHTLHLPDGKIVDLRDGTPDPLAFVKFFELADVGISAEDRLPREKSDAPGALLKEVRKDSPFASGLRAGDRIIAVEGKKTPTTEILRRTLRRQLAEDEPTITFTVQRSGKTMAVSVPMKR